MEFINYISSAAIPIIMAIIIIYGLFEKNKVYDTFVEGAKEGLEIVVKLFPTLLGIMTKFGVDSKIGLIASTIMGSTETTFYTIAIYTSCVGIKKTKFVLAAALIGDLVRNACFCSNLGNFVVKFFLTKVKKDCIMYT